MQNTAGKQKIYYIDNLRVLMTVLVVLHHTLITYGATGGWYFTDPTQQRHALIVMTLMVATNQAFFMGFFFFLSALFTEPSYQKKGPVKFLLDRLKRLGIPLLFYSFILGPLMNFLIYRYGRHKQATLMQYLSGYDNWIDPGVMWFVLALLVFTFIYFLVKQFTQKRVHKNYGLPTGGKIFVFAFLLGIATYLVRIIFPIGWVLKPLGFQLAHFPQYISMYILGIIASRNDWMNTINNKAGKKWLIVALIFVLVIFPTIFILNKSPLETFMGKGTWQSLVVALWEQITGVSIMVALLGIGQTKWNFTTGLLQKASRSAFATYIFHPLVIIAITLLLLPVNIEPVIKLIIATPFVIILSFSLGWIITKIPLAKEIV